MPVRFSAGAAVGQQPDIQQHERDTGDYPPAKNLEDA
jgi:hypothetical protein